MRTRKDIQSEIQEKRNAVQKLKDELRELYKENKLYSDVDQWFKEEMETSFVRENRKKIKVERLIGRIYWNEDFKDEGTGEVVTIERNQVVRVDGKWEPIAVR